MTAAWRAPSAGVTPEHLAGSKSIYVRAIIFKIIFHVMLGLWMIGLSLMVPFSDRGRIARGFRNFARIARWLLSTITGIELEIRGAENLPKGKAFIFSGKHSSTLDAVAVLITLPYLSALAKQELFSIPFLGPVLKKIGLHPIDRSSGDAHKDTTRIVKLIIAQQRPLIVFPEGTRVREGQEKPLKSGAYHIQKDLDISVITGASNAGYAWPAHKLLMRRCKVVFEIHPPMPSGLDKEAFMAELRSRIVDRSKELTEANAKRPVDR